MFDEWLNEMLWSLETCLLAWKWINWNCGGICPPLMSWVRWLQFSDDLSRGLLFAPRWDPPWEDRAATCPSLFYLSGILKPQDLPSAGSSRLSCQDMGFLVIVWTREKIATQVHVKTLILALSKTHSRPDTHLVFSQWLSHARYGAGHEGIRPSRTSHVATWMWILKYN